ncbi:protein MIS12 homolog [Haliotis rubra]|uniref:protein MIS12 homolog n=1 Tax=Haliotis rubra TaxID=36100 RepID=UPI001EE54A63|nr:protein MIS12 homolog [Haliotis rubra]
MSVSSCTTVESVTMVTDEMTSGQSSQKQAEYETQYFGFTPKSFSNGVYNAVNDYMMDGLQAVEGYMNTEYGDVIAPSQVNEGVQKMQQKMAKQVDKAFDTLEAYLFTNIFCIPENTVLPEDRVKQDKMYTEDEEKKIHKDIEEYTQKILAVKHANTCLQGELDDIDRAQAQMNLMLKQTQDMQQVLRQAGVTDVKDSLVYGANQVLKRVNLLKDIQVVSNKNSIKGEDTKKS